MHSFPLNWTFCCRCRCVTVLGTVYKVEKCCMLIGTTQIQSGVAPQFGLLYDILLYGKDPTVLLIFILMETVKYNPIFGAYELVSVAQYRCVYRASIQCYHPFNPIRRSDSTTLIKSKYYDLTVYCNY